MKFITGVTLMILCHAERSDQCHNSPAYIIVKGEDDIARIQNVINWMMDHTVFVYNVPLNFQK